MKVTRGDAAWLAVIAGITVVTLVLAVGQGALIVLIVLCGGFFAVAARVVRIRFRATGGGRS